jgi:hypothetical protein
MTTIYPAYLVEYLNVTEFATVGEMKVVKNAGGNFLQLHGSLVT